MASMGYFVYNSTVMPSELSELDVLTSQAPLCARLSTVTSGAAIITVSESNPFNLQAARCKSAVKPSESASGRDRCPGAVEPLERSIQLPGTAPNGSYWIGDWFDRPRSLKQ